MRQAGRGLARRRHGSCREAPGTPSNAAQPAGAAPAARHPPCLSDPFGGLFSVLPHAVAREEHVADAHHGVLLPRHGQLHKKPAAADGRAQAVSAPPSHSHGRRQTLPCPGTSGRGWGGCCHARGVMQGGRVLRGTRAGRPNARAAPTPRHGGAPSGPSRTSAPHTLQSPGSGACPSCSSEQHGCVPWSRPVPGVQRPWSRSQGRARDGGACSRSGNSRPLLLPQPALRHPGLHARHQQAASTHGQCACRRHQQDHRHD